MAWLEMWNIFSNNTITGTSAFHIHDRCELLYIKKGYIQTEINNIVYKATEGQLVVINPLVTHDLIPVKLPYERVGMHVQTSVLSHIGISSFYSSVLQRNIKAPCQVFDLKNNPVAVRVIDELWLEFSTNSSFKQEYMLALFSQLLILLYRQSPENFTKPSADNQMEEVKKYLEDNLSDFLSVNEIAAKYFITPSHFIVRFKKYTGYTPQKYRSLCRMARARCLLLENNLSLNEIAEKCGFSDLNSFVRAFKKIMGITPGRFRQLIGNSDTRI